MVGCFATYQSTLEEQPAIPAQSGTSCELVAVHPAQHAAACTET